MVAVESLVESVSVGQWVSQRDGEGLEGKAERDSEKELGGGWPWRPTSKVPMGWR